MHIVRLVVFSERILKRERAYRMRLVGLGVLSSVNASCRVFRTRLDKGACLSKASCRSWRLVMSECVLSCFSERVLTRERAYWKHLVGLGILLWANASCCVFRTRLDKGACHLKASCRFWRLVKCECVLSCFPNASWQGSVQCPVDLGVLLSVNVSCRVFVIASWQGSVPIESVL